MLTDIILCFVGESGSGKTTVAEYLENNYHFNVIRSYTTRKPRDNNDKSHIFVDINQFDKQILNQPNVIASTYFDGNYYWATKEMYLRKGISIYVIDPKGAYELYQKINDAKIITIYFKTDSNVRYERMLKSRTIEEAQKRLSHDTEAFKIIKCDYVINANNSVKETANNIIQILKQEGVSIVE